MTLLHWLEQCCDLYNAALQERRDAWNKQRVAVSRIDQQKGLAEWRRSDPDGAAVSSDVQRSALARVEKTFKAFFERVQTGKTPGFPRFRSKSRYGSFSVPGTHVHLEGDRVLLPKLPGIKVHLYRPLRGRPLQVSVRRCADRRWFISFACDIGEAPPKVAPESIVGIDLGLKSLVFTSDGEAVKNPRHALHGAERLARAQRVLARRKRGSKSRERARVQVARAHAHVRNQRLDHARKVAASLVSRYDVISHEDLNVFGLARSALASSVNRAGWGILLHCIACKAEEAGKHVVAVDPRGTSQRCSGCGETVQKALSERAHDCPHCGLRMNRDHNAAVNICALGRSAVPWPEALDPTQARKAA